MQKKTGHTENRLGILSVSLWREALKDIGRLCLYLAILYIVGMMAVWLHVYMFLEAQKTNMDAVMAGQNIEETGVNVGLYHFLSTATGYYMTVLAFFAAFFSIPPKDMQHMARVLFLLFLLMMIAVFPASFAAIVYSFIALAGFVLVPWMLSLLYHWRS